MSTRIKRTLALLLMLAASREHWLLAASETPVDDDRCQFTRRDDLCTGLDPDSKPHKTQPPKQDRSPDESVEQWERIDEFEREEAPIDVVVTKPLRSIPTPPQASPLESRRGIAAAILAGRRR